MEQGRSNEYSVTAPLFLLNRMVSSHWITSHNKPPLLLPFETCISVDFSLYFIFTLKIVTAIVTEKLMFQHVRWLNHESLQYSSDIGQRHLSTRTIPIIFSEVLHLSLTALLVSTSHHASFSLPLSVSLSFRSFWLSSDP